MSRRTAPLYGGHHCPEAQLARFRDSQRSTSCIFTALEDARFDDVRRAVAANPLALLASNTFGNPHSPHGSSPDVHITPVDYGLDLCRLWESMLVHCERAGAVLVASGYVNMRRRLAVMANIIEWLVTQPKAPLPSHHALHTVISCNFGSVARILVVRAPTLACSTDLRGKTPLHVCFKLTPRASPVEILNYVRLLREAGADVTATDVDGITPLHELVMSLTTSQRAWGLERTRNYRASLKTLSKVIDYLILEGADIFAMNKRGLTPLDISMREGLDYLILVRSADRIFRLMCKIQRKTVALDTYVTDKKMGWFQLLPYDIILKILSHLSPRDAVTGIGTTCKTMQALATSEHIWTRLSAASSMAVARNSMRRKAVEGEREIA